jgi:hypothetical protein
MPAMTRPVQFVVRLLRDVARSRAELAAEDALLRQGTHTRWMQTCR